MKKLSNLICGSRGTDDTPSDSQSEQSSCARFTHGMPALGCFPRSMPPWLARMFGKPEGIPVTTTPEGIRVTTTTVVSVARASLSMLHRELVVGNTEPSIPVPPPLPLPLASAGEQPHVKSERRAYVARLAQFLQGGHADGKPVAGQASSKEFDELQLTAQALTAYIWPTLEPLRSDANWTKEVFDKVVFPRSGNHPSGWAPAKATELAQIIRAHQDKVDQGLLEPQDAQLACIEQLDRLFLGQELYARLHDAIVELKPQVEQGTIGIEQATQRVREQAAPWPQAPFDEGSYYQQRALIADVFKTREAVLEELAEADPDARSSWMQRLDTMHRGPWVQGQPAPDTPPLEGLCVADASVDGDGFGAISVLTTNSKLRLIGKTMNDPDDEHALQRTCDMQGLILERMKGQWHRNLARVYAVKDEGAGWRHPMLLMEEVSPSRLNGQRVMEWMCNALSGGLLTSREFVGAMQFVARRLLDVSDYLTRARVAHNDLKPANVVFHDIGEPIVVDFDTMSKMGATTDTIAPAYAPPERRAGWMRRDFGKATEASEVYSIGATILEGLQGQVRTASEALPELGTEIYTPVGGDTMSRFLKDLMDPDPAKRSTAQTAQMHPAMTDRLLSDAQALAVIRKVMALMKTETAMKKGTDDYQKMHTPLELILRQPTASDVRALLHFRQRCMTMREGLGLGTAQGDVQLRGSREFDELLKGKIESIELALCKVTRDQYQELRPHLVKLLNSPKLGDIERLNHCKTYCDGLRQQLAAGPGENPWPAAQDFDAFLQDRIRDIETAKQRLEAPAPQHTTSRWRAVLARFGLGKAVHH